MKLSYLAFTDKGYELAQQLAEKLGGQAERCNKNNSLKEWTESHFESSEGLIFVGAVGIAVRAIAPYIKSKASDPAVVAVDEMGKFAITLLSGHLGSGNDLAKEISRVCGALTVITTATDINDVFAVDEWAKRQNCKVIDISKIKNVSSAVLKGKTVYVKSFVNIKGEMPLNVKLTDEDDFDVLLDVCRLPLRQSMKEQDSLIIVPKIAVLGVGCRKGTEFESIKECFEAFKEETGIFSESICAVTSIDLKKNENGLVKFADSQNVPFITFSTEELAKAEGSFSKSAFVKQITGVDNVCERSAVLEAKGTLYKKKYTKNGVTMALALKPYTPDWRWKNE